MESGEKVYKTKNTNKQNTHKNKTAVSKDENPQPT